MNLLQKSVVDCRVTTQQDHHDTKMKIVNVFI